MKNNTLGDKFFVTTIYVVLFLLLLITLYPFWQTVVLSISSRKDALQAGLHLYTKEVDFSAYKQIFSMEDFWLCLKNSVVRVIVGTIICVVGTSLTAYPLAKADMPFNKFFTIMFVITMLFGGGLIPTYLVYKWLKLTDTFWVLVLPGCISAYNVIIMRNFIRSIPEDMSESALIDGTNEIIIWWKIILPLSKPALATIALWSAVGHWNDYFSPLIYITDQDKFVLPIILRRILIENQSEMFAPENVAGDVVTQSTSETLKSALIVASTLPILVFYPFLQKYFTKGIMLGAVKG